MRARQAKMDRFFDWLAKRHQYDRHTDMARVLPDDLQAYKEALPKGIARDHLIDVRAHFNTAAKNNKFPWGNPAVGLFLPASRKKAKRVEFTDDERKLIVSRARESDDPVIKWSNLIASITGAGTAEIIDADTRDVEVVDGIVVFHIRTDYRAYGDDDLKTEFRGRSLPAHPGVAKDFLAYRDAVRRDYYDGGDGPLFPQIAADADGVRNHRASMRIMRFLRRIGIKNEPGFKRHFYSWRHTVTTQLEALTTGDRARYIVGHGGRDVHARDYLKHPVPELLKVIRRLPDPMKL
jgi:integrase